MCEIKSERGTAKAEKGETVSGARGVSVVDPVLDPVIVADVDMKRSSELWQIHGKHFDLSSFLPHHPGGAGILEAVRGAEDSTAAFESYHAMANTEAIRKTLEKYEWKGKLLDDIPLREAHMMGGTRKEPLRYRWDAGGFYAALKARVKRHFLEKHGQSGVDPAKTSVNRYVKATPAWYLKVVLVLSVYVPLFVYMMGFDMFGLGVSLTGWARAGPAFLAGAMLQSFSFCVLHDASHYGLFFKKPQLQEAISRVCNAWTLWHHGLWVMHHVYGHHSFTGDHQRDPDMMHAQPYIRKSVLAPREKYNDVAVRWQGFHTPIFMMLVPGATLGQTYAYSNALKQGSLWRVTLTDATYNTRWYEYVTYALAIGAHIIGGNLWVSLCYFTGISVAYHLCIAPDHDTFESAVVNSIEQKRVLGARGGVGGDGDRAREGDGAGEKAKVLVEGSARPRKRRVGSGDPSDDGDDWGEVQVRHSGNFSTKSFLVTQLMGGINYQIEHHLFPSMSHMFYEEIAPIVKATCREFNIPYNAHPTLWSAYKSYMKTIRICSHATALPET